MDTQQNGLRCKMNIESLQITRIRKLMPVKINRGSRHFMSTCGDTGMDPIRIDYEAERRRKPSSHRVGRRALTRQVVKGVKI